MFGDLGKMMQQVKEMKSSMKVAQKELESLIVETSSKNNEILVRISGDMELKDFKLNSEILKLPVQEIEKLILNTLKDAIAKAKKQAADKLSKVTGGLSLPGM